MSNIIDFNSSKKRRQRRLAKEEALPNARAIGEGMAQALESVDKYLAQLPQDGMMQDAIMSFRDRLSMLMTFSMLAAHVNAELTRAGIDPNPFCVNESSLDLFLADELEESDGSGEDGVDFFNGPFFEGGDDEYEYRVGTTVCLQGEGTAMAAHILRRREEEDDWETWFDGKWEKQGPPAEIFEALAMERIKELMFDVAGDRLPPEAWDEDAWDEDNWEENVDSLMLTPSVIAALHKAGIHEIEQLRDMTDEQLLAIKGIGKKSLKQIREALEDEF